LKKTTRISDAVSPIPNGASILIGGFMGVGTPPRLINELIRQGKRDLVIIANDTARPGVGIGRLIDEGLVRKAIVSHIGTNPETQRQMIAGSLEVELVPQGTLIERIRAGGCGLGGILTPTGLGTVVQDGKQIVVVDDRPFLLERPLRGDFALLGARQADYYGNLSYALTARNFNPLIAMAATIVLAEPQSIVPVGVIPPDAVMTPAVLVTHLILRERSNG
jgi:acetate CoA/acetoacetate CoA-transferase alpha subunit